ncbi:MAG: DNA repair protein RecO [Balneolaceae bacterium]
MITETTIIVLKTVQFSESSLIATVFSKEHGKIAVIAKGAKKPKSKFAGLIEPGKLLSVIYYYKPTRSVQTLSDATSEARLDSLTSDMEKMAISMSVVELVTQLIHEGEVNEPVYDFTRNFLIWLHEQDRVTRLVFPYVQIRLAQLLGLGLQLETEDENSRLYFNISAGTLSGKPDSGHSAGLTASQEKFLRQAITTRNKTILHQTISKNELSELIDHLDKYFRYHLEGIKPRKSDAIFDQILKN